MADYPTSLDTFENPVAGNLLSSPDHSLQHTNAYAALLALETKLGIGSVTPTAIGATLISTGSGGSQYEAPAFYLIGNRSGYYTSLVPGDLTAITSTVNTGNNYCLPFYSPGGTVDRLACNVTTAGAAGAVARMGIYNGSASNPFEPGSLLLDAGTVATDTTGFKEITISQTLSVGIYWATIVAQTASGALFTATSNANWGGSFGICIGSTIGNTAIMSYTDSSVNGALPDPYVQAGVSSNAPNIWVRWA